MHFLTLLAFLVATRISLGTPVMMHRHHKPDHGSVMRHRSTFDSASGDNVVLARAPSPNRRRAANRCIRRNSTSTSTLTSTTTPSVPKNIGGLLSSTSTSSSSSSSSPTPTDAPTKVRPNGYWPSKTQSGDTYSATVASPTDPHLLSISEALNNENNPLFQNEHTGDLTYYATGIVACGDTYTESSLTAAIGKLLWDAWPGAVSDTTKNPVCGPYTPGRKMLNSAGLFYDAVTSDVGSTWIGGNGVPSCDPVVKVQCHIPLTVTITNPDNGESVSGVKVVDRCDGCQGQGDIDVTETVFQKLGNMTQGRISGIKWKFDSY